MSEAQQARRLNWGDRFAILILVLMGLQFAFWLDSERLHGAGYDCGTFYRSVGRELKATDGDFKCSSHCVHYTKGAFCSAPCSADSECPAGFACYAPADAPTESAAFVHECLLKSRAVGEPCTHTYECVSGLCIQADAVVTEFRRCSQPCGPGAPACPSGWRCGEPKWGGQASVCVSPK